MTTSYTTQTDHLLARLRNGDDYLDGELQAARQLAALGYTRLLWEVAMDAQARVEAREAAAKVLGGNDDNKRYRLFHTRS